MQTLAALTATVLFALAAGQASASAKDNPPTVLEACEVLKNFRGEYSYGGLGLGAESNDGELALWVITRSPDATATLTSLYSQCRVSGKAYILAALYHKNRKAFSALTNDFFQDIGEVVVGSGCEGWTVSRSDLVAQMQNSKSPLAFRPSRKPLRRTAMTFTGSERDVYEELHQERQEEMESKERALEALARNPKLAAFTNMFFVDDAEDGRGSTSGVYFIGADQWSADFLPKAALSFGSMIETVFPKSNGVVQVGISPNELLDELKHLTELPFLKEMNKSLPVDCVRIRAAGDRLHWNSDEVAKFEEVLKTGVPLRDWVYFIVDAGSRPNRMIGFYHPKGCDIYVVDGLLFENPDWREQYRKLTGNKPKRTKGLGGLPSWENPDSKYLPVVDRSGTLRLFPSTGKL
jgi:hypothetical protein